MTGELKVSVCVVTYNQIAYIDECLRSIVEQDVTFPFEILVSDDGSTDGTREIISRFAAKYPGVVKPVFRGENLGPFQNYIDTHNRAIGAYVAHCDGDDMFLPGKLQIQADYLDLHPDCTLVYGSTQVFNDPGESWTHAPRAFDALPNGRFDLPDLLRLGSIGIHSAQMYRRTSRRTTDVSFVAMDYFYALELLQSGRGQLLSTIVTRYRYNVNAGTMTTSSAGQARNKRLIAGYMRSYLNIRPDLRRDVFIGAVTHLFIDIKNRRPTASIFARLALQSVVAVAPSRLIENLRQISLFKTRSPPEFRP